MKVFFVPGYLYNSLPDFEKVIESLRKKEERADVAIVHKQEGNKIWSAAGYNENYFSSKNLKLIKLPVLGRYETTDTSEEIPPPASSSKKVFQKLANFYRLLIDFYKIGSFLKTEKPDLVVVTSDLGPGKFVRFVSEHCMLQNIPIVILYTFDLPETPAPALTTRLQDFLFHSNLGIFRFARAIIQERLPDNLPVGSYALKATIYTVSHSVKNKLLAGGIQNDRIMLVKTPVMGQDESTKAEVLRKLDIPLNNKVVTLFSERIEQFYYGQEYIRKLYESMADTFNKLSTELEVFFVVKPHPCESRETVQLIEEVFTGDHFRITRDISAEELISVSDISIAHFSKVLITASLMDKMFLSINVMNDRQHTFIPEGLTDVLEMKSFSDIEGKTRDVLTSEPYAEKVKSASRSIAKSFNSSDKEFVDVLLETLKS